MLTKLADWLSGHIFYPLWDIKDRSPKLNEWRELERLQWLPVNELERIQWQKLQLIIDYAVDQSPWYRELLKKAGVKKGTPVTPDVFSNIEITTKHQVRNNTREFISDEFEQDQLVTAKTGGSTGVSLNLYFDEQCQERRNAAQLLADRWAGWELGMKRAAVWGNPPTPATLKEKLRHHLLDRMIYLDTMDLNDRSMGDFVTLWRAENPRAIFGHAHSIYIFARYLLDKQVTDLRPKAIIATSMMLLDHERQTIEQAFACAATNRYGCEEVGLIACECEHHNGMHINLPHVYVEVLDENNQPVQPGEPGKIVVTDLNNFAMPLIRYRVEDVGVLGKEKCECGRGLPLLARIEGRVADFLIKPDGGRVAGVSLVERTLTKVPGVEQMQLVQTARDLVEINRVKGRDFSESTDASLISALREVFDEQVNLEILDVEKIPQEASGKYRFSICKVSE